MSMRGTNTLLSRAIVRWEMIGCVKALYPCNCYANGTQVLAKDPESVVVLTATPVSITVCFYDIIAHICHTHPHTKLFPLASLSLLPWVYFHFFLTVSICLTPPAPSPSTCTHTHTPGWGPPSICRDWGEEFWKNFLIIWDLVWTSSVLFQWHRIGGRGGSCDIHIIIVLFNNGILDPCN